MKPQTKLVAIMLLLSLILGVFGFGGTAMAAEDEQGTFFASPILVVNTSFLNVRVGPAVGYGVLAVVVGGTELPVLGIAPDGVWYQVATGVGPGWVNVTFTLPRGDFSHVPEVDFMDTSTTTTTTVASLGQGGGGSVPAATADWTCGGTTSPEVAARWSVRPWGVSLILASNLYLEPENTSPVVRELVGPTPDDVFPIQCQTYANGELWIRISVPNEGMGWVEAHRFIYRPLVCCVSNQTAVVLNGSTNLSGGIDGTVLAGTYQVHSGMEAYVIGMHQNEVKLEFFDGTSGWVDAGWVDARSEAVICHCDGSLCGGAPASWQVGASTTTTVTTGTTVSPVVSTGITGPHVVVNTGNLNVRTGPGAGYSVVATVPGGTELAVIGVAPDGVWFWIEAHFGRGWVNNQYTLFRGDYGSIPTVDFRNLGVG